ncbi:hypothetical protein BKA67DRAFT_544780, partial [Truncatella angustata]
MLLLFPFWFLLDRNPSGSQIGKRVWGVPGDMLWKLDARVQVGLGCSMLSTSIAETRRPSVYLTDKQTCNFYRHCPY